MQSKSRRFEMKSFTGCDFGLFETRLLTEGDMRDIWRVSHCPTIFQEHIEGEYDLRITVVGTEIFAARLLFKEGRHPVDSRVDRVPVKATTLPIELNQKILSLVGYLGLTYAAIDMRLGTDGSYTFFESNPEGQFLWIEIETGLPISDALASVLTFKDKATYVGPFPRQQSWRASPIR
jgi:hypothetical protein